MARDRDLPSELIYAPFPEAMMLWLRLSEADASPPRVLWRLHMLSVALVLMTFGIIALLAWLGGA